MTEGTRPPVPLQITAEVELPTARIQLARLNHRRSRSHLFSRQGVFWVDLCLTPRRPTAMARYIDHWGPHRFAEMGSIIALPPDQRLELKSAGGHHASLLCQLRADALNAFLPAGFAWTDRRLEACLNITSEQVRSLLLRLNQELRAPGTGSTALCQAIVDQLAIELARYLTRVDKPDEKGGLAAWRQRIIDERIAQDGPLPTVAELAALCRISARHLGRGFRTSRGCSIGDHLLNVRIEAAKRKLASSDSIQQISASIGYANQSSFTAAFRKATGTTPNRYRDRIRQPHSHKPDA